MNSSQKNNSISLNTAVGSTASLGTLLVGAAIYLPEPFNKMLILSAPILSSSLSWVGIYFYNKLIEPPAVVAFRAGYKKDMKEQLEIINDENCDEETRNNARKIYSETRLKIATLRQDFASGKLKVTIAQDDE